MTDSIQEALAATIKEVNAAIADSKREAIMAIRNDDPVNVDDLKKLQKLLGALETAKSSYSPSASPKRRGSIARRAQRGAGDHVPTQAIVVPLLQALSDLGGQAQAEKVLALVAEKLPLKADDVRGTAYRPDIPRWRNSAGWVRYELTKQGCIALDSSKRGLWTLTPKGEAYLRDATREQTSAHP